MHNDVPRGSGPRGWLTYAEAAPHLHIAVSTLRRYVREEQVPYVEHRGTRYIEGRAIKKVLDDRVAASEARRRKRARS